MNALYGKENALVDVNAYIVKTGNMRIPATIAIFILIKLERGSEEEIDQVKQQLKSNDTNFT